MNNTKNIRLFTAFLLTMLCATVIAANLPDFTDLASKSKKFVVHITTKKNTKTKSNVKRGNAPGLDNFLRRFYGQPNTPQQQSSLGSGFIYDKNGYIITNHHVIKDADEVEVSLEDLNVYTAKVVGSDPISDIALLKIAAKNLPYARLGNSDKLKPGEWVFAIGSPFGFGYTVTKGIVSAVSRSVGNVTYVPFIQTDVPTNPGNSGGPLINLRGEVVGVNSMILSRTGTYSGVSFAIPVSTVKQVVTQLRLNKKVIRGWLGVAIQVVNRQLASSFGLKKPEGALVSSVVEDSPAQKAGLQAGDIILKFHKSKINIANNLPFVVGASPINTPINMIVFRDKKRKRITVNLSALKEDSLNASMDGSGNPTPASTTSYSFFGMTVEKNPKGKGVIIKEVTGGPAKKAELVKGDILLKIGRRVINNLKDCKNAVKKLRSNSSVPLRVMRGKSSRFIAIKTPKKK